MISNKLLVASLALGTVSVTAFGADPPKETKESAQKISRSAKKPVHLAVKSGSDAKQIFTYFPYPALPTEYQFSRTGGTGVYRLSVDEQGAVTQIQILKRFGEPVIDAEVLKTFIRWRAQPGPARIVDVPFTFTPGYMPVRRSEGSHIPRH
jgi:TonB family protein